MSGLVGLASSIKTLRRRGNAGYFYLSFTNDVLNGYPTAFIVLR